MIIRNYILNQTTYTNFIFLAHYNLIFSDETILKSMFFRDTAAHVKNTNSDSYLLWLRSH